MFASLAECRQTPGPDSGIEALGAGPEVWRLRSHTLAALQRTENQLSGPAFPASKEDSVPSRLRAESHLCLGSTGWEVSWQWQWPLGPCAQGGLPHSQGTSRQPPHGCSVTFALQERARELRPVCTVLGSCGQNTLGAHLEPGPGSQTGFFRLRSPNAGRPSNCLQRPPMAVCFLLPELALLPASVFHKLGADLPFFARGPLEVPGVLGYVTPAWHPAPSDTLLQPPSSWAVLH